MAAFMFTSVDISGDNDFMIWVTKNQVHVYFRSVGERILKKDFEQNKWLHVCWTWENTGKYWTYLNGVKEKSGLVSDTLFRQDFPESHGNLLLGQDKDEDYVNQKSQMLHGAITQFYIFNKTLSTDEVVSVYQSRLPKKDVVVGWWQFKNLTHGHEIFEVDFPSEIIDRKISVTKLSQSKTKV